MSFTPSEGRIHLYKKQMNSPASFQLLWADLQALADAGFLDKKLTQLDPRHISYRYKATELWQHFCFQA